MAHFQFVRKMWYSDAKGASSGRDRGWGIVEDVGKAGPGVGVAASDERPGVGAGAPRVERRDMARVLIEQVRMRHGRFFIYPEYDRAGICQDFLSRQTV